METSNQAIDACVETQTPFDSYFSEEDLALICEKEKLFESITGDFSADQGKLSKKERFGSAKLLGNKNLAYGEITYATLHKVVLWIEKHFECKIGENFFDLGHGTGKAIVAAAIIGSFKQISGVELLDGLYYQSVRQKDKFIQLSGDTSQKICLLQGNFLDQSCDWWTSSDFVYMNNVFEDDLITQIGQRASLMKSGSWFVTLFKPLPADDKWEHRLTNYMTMSWGTALVHVHYKLM